MSAPPFDSKLFDSHLKTRWLGRSIICKDVTETTMDDAKLAAKTGSPYGTIILAETQTKARGTKSHKWDALNKGNLYVSLIINRKIQQGEFVDIFDVEMSGALSTMKVLQDLGLQDVKMKWPNDLWVRGHKLGGFLAENSGIIPGSSENIFILGIGLNVNADIRRHPDLHTIATSVRCELDGQVINREKVFADICNNLEATLEWNRDTLYTTAMENHLFNPGTTLKITHAVGGKISVGQLEKIQDNWDIVFKDESGQVWQGTSQQYSIRPYTTKMIYVYNGILTASWSATLLIKTFSSLVDTCQLALSSLNDAKLKEGSWRQNAAMLVIGDIIMKDSPSGDAKDFLSSILNYVENGGKLFASGNVVDIICNAALMPSEKENVPVSLEDLDISDNATKEMSSIKFKSKNSEKEFLGVTVNKKLSLSTEVLQQCDVVGLYWPYKDQDTDTGAVMATYGKGIMGLVGLNIGITYADIGDITNNTLVNNVSDIDKLEETVYERDVFVQNIINYLLKN